MEARLVAAPAPQEAISPAPTRVEHLGLGYLWTPPGGRFTLHADYLKERSDEFTAEVTVTTAGATGGTSGHLHEARLNFSSTRAKDDYAKHLATLTGDDVVPWRRLIEQFCAAVKYLERQGEPKQYVGRRPRRIGQQEYLIEQLLPMGKPTIWYGPQGVGKGWLSTTACVCHATGQSLGGFAVRTGRPLYLDWEDDEETLNTRVQLVAAGLGIAPPEVVYRKCRRTLVRDLHTILRMVSEEAITLVVVDSVGLAAGAKTDAGGYEDVALGLFEALRHLEPATCLLIDHLTGANLREEGLAGKPFGSIYKMAEARAAWEIRAQQLAGAAEAELALFHTKFNHSKKFPPVGLRLTFGPDGAEPIEWVRLARYVVAENDELRKRLPFADQLEGVLRAGPQTVKDAAVLLEAGEDKVRTYLNRGAGRRFVRLGDSRWGLLDVTRTANDAAGQPAWTPATPENVKTPGMRPPVPARVVPFPSRNGHSTSPVGDDWPDWMTQEESEP